MHTLDDETLEMCCVRACSKDSCCLLINEQQLTGEDKRDENINHALRTTPPSTPVGLVSSRGLWLSRDSLLLSLPLESIRSRMRSLVALAALATVALAFPTDPEPTPAVQVYGSYRFHSEPSIAVGDHCCSGF